MDITEVKVTLEQLKKELKEACAMRVTVRKDTRNKSKLVDAYKAYYYSATDMKPIHSVLDKHGVPRNERILGNNTEYFGYVAFRLPKPV